jgi:hypothetical protein
LQAIYWLFIKSVISAIFFDNGLSFRSVFTPIIIFFCNNFSIGFFSSNFSISSISSS